MSSRVKDAAQAIARRWRILLLTSAVGAAYFIAAHFGLTMALSNRIVSPVWPPTGIALGAMLLWGYRVWPGVFVGAFLAYVMVLARTTSTPALSAFASLAIAAGNTLEALGGAWLANRFAKGRNAFNRPQTIFRFVALTAMVGTIVSPLVGLSTLSLTGLGRWENFASLGLTWWLGDVVGAIVVTPMFLLWGTRPFPRFGRKDTFEIVALLLLLGAVCGVLFFGWVFPTLRQAPLALLLIPIVLWPALRLGRRGTVTTIFIVAALAIVGTVHGRGPFGFENEQVSLLLLQEFLAIAGVMAMVLAADVAVRQETDASLRASEKRYRELFEDSPQAMWVYDYETLRFLAVNHAAVQHYGYSADEFLNMRVTDLSPPEDVHAVLELQDKARAGETIRTARRHRIKNGAPIDVEIARHNLLYENRPATMVLCTDITRRKRAEKRLATFSVLGRWLSGVRTSREAAQLIADSADSLFGWDAFTFDLYSPDQKSFQPVLGMTKDGGARHEGPPEGLEPKIEEHWMRALQCGPQLVLRSEQEAGGRPGRASSIMLSGMFVPVQKGSNSFGILSIQSRSANAYSEDDLRTLQALADHCAGALERIGAEAAKDESQEQLRLALSASKMGVWAMEVRDGQQVFFASPELDAIFGLAPGEFKGTPAEMYALIHPDDRELIRTSIEKALTRPGEFDLVFRILPHNRPMAWLLGRGRTYLNPQGKLLRLAGVGIDITDRKAVEAEVLRLNAELERRVGERTAQLNAINRELEAFCYSVSHDLRAPLRSIRGFSEVVLQRYASQLDPRAQDFLRRACLSSHHMDDLIEDLLRLSRVSRGDLHSQQVDLTALASNIAAELRLQEPKRKVEWILAPGLRATADERLMRVVLQNLLNNAWKFSSKQAKTRIEFGSISEPESAFFVRDNGAGFDMAYASKLFGAFQRLHSASDFPGTGVGLATVQRIINRHGGRVWAGGAVGQGATFYFTLPRNGKS